MTLLRLCDVVLDRSQRRPFRNFIVQLQQCQDPIGIVSKEYRKDNVDNQEKQKQKQNTCW